MSANLTTVNGEVQFVSGQNIPVWHRSGKVVPGLMTCQEALEFSGANFRAREAKLQVSGNWKHDGETVYGGKIEGYKAIVREDNGAILGVHSDKYKMIQYSEFADFIDGIIAEGQLNWDTCGLLGENGEMMFACLQVPGQLFIDTPRGKEEMRRMIMILNSHNGKYAPQAMFSGVRPVCANTVNAALRTATNRCAVRHTKNWENNKQEIGKTLKLASAYFDNLAALMTELANQPVNEKQIDNFCAELLPAREVQLENGEIMVEVSARAENLRNDIKSLIVEGTGNAGETRFDCLNGVTEFIDHKQTRKQGAKATQIESIMLTTGLKMKERALEILTTSSLN